VVKNHITYIIFEERREKPLFGLASHTQKIFALWPKHFICLAKILPCMKKDLARSRNTVTVKIRKFYLMIMDIKSLFDVKGKTAVLTGGTGVLGGAMAKAIAAAGVNTVVLGRNKTNGDNLAAEIRKNGGEACFLPADVLQTDDLMKANEKVISTYGTIDILINAAGGNLAGAVISPQQNFFDLKMEEFQKVVDLNLTGTVLPCKVFCQDMANRKKGVVVNIASMSSYRPITRVVGYSAAKSAVMNFTEWLAIEMAKKFGEGIRVNAIAPGFFITEQNRNLLTNPDGTFTPRGQDALRSTPFNRFGEPDELVGTLLWLCSDASKFVTGVTIPVDGGFNVFCGV
jgi:NAD(P)-dependent dehydrogenase (short-subunit alcohol dehydrogenase family)